ncbi:MAG: hypothetical protein A3H27_02455 [Acidobacteria bacterium RIFCSPLOWO2_02_FULL_59_13]|nr:MAG: hypothetical protein A3H27_02455 [Acidobacteria bacterium RIFCSPLOWO2_02_FULL_59_13]
MSKDVQELRAGILAIDRAASHRATKPPDPSEIYTPSHHVSALDPDNSLVVGIRGVGKSFWASALGDDAARSVASTAYPKLALNTYSVGFGFTGFEGDDAPSPETVRQYGTDTDTAKLFWRVVVLRAFANAAKIRMPQTYRDLMAEFSDSEKREAIMRKADAYFERGRKRFLLVFDALDTLSTNWANLRLLTRALLEVTYGMRSYRSLRLKLFLRPEQLDDPAVGFTDLSKLKAGKIDLSWDNVDLYGLFFTRLANENASRAAFKRLAQQQQIELKVKGDRAYLPVSLTRDPNIQQKAFIQLAGRYMGSDHRKGKTFTWLPAHLADGFRMVTPRSFLTSLREAASKSEAAEDRVLTIEGIKEGLRAASRVRVDQLKEEYQWIELALLPLAGLRVPCSEAEIIEPWINKRTVSAIDREAGQEGYLGPSEMPSFDPTDQARAKVRELGLLNTLLKIGVLERRSDERINMPDIFRIGASLIGRGRITPEK